MGKSFKTKLLNFVLALAMVVTVFAVPNCEAKAAGLTPVTNLHQTSADKTGVTVEFNAVEGMGIEYECRVYSDAARTNIVAQSSFSGRTYVNVYGLTQGRTYYVEIETIRYVRYGQYERENAKAVVEVVTRPAADSTMKAKQTGMKDKEATLSWPAVAGATRYRVEYKAPTWAESKVAYANTNSYTIKGLSKNSKYETYIYAERETSNKAFVAKDMTCINVDSSKSKCYGVKTLPELAGRLSTSFDQSASKVKIAYYDGKADGYSYTVMSEDGKKKYAKNKTAANNYTVEVKNKAFKKDNIFRVDIKAYNLDGNGKKCYSKAKTFYFSPYVHINDSYSKNGKATVKWRKIAGADRYLIYAVKDARRIEAKDYKKVATVSGKKNSVSFDKINKKKLSKGKYYRVTVLPQKKVGKKYVNLTSETYYWPDYFIAR